MSTRSLGSNDSRWLNAGYLPGLDPDDVAWHHLQFDTRASTLSVAVPVLTQTQLAHLCARVRAAQRDILAPRSVNEIIDVIDQAIARLLDRNDPYRRQADRFLPLVTGFDARMVHLGFSEYLKTFRKAELTRFVCEDFPNPQVLDRFQPAAKGGFVKANGPPLLAHIWAGNVPGLPLWSFICGLLVKAGNIGKVPSAEPLLAGWFASLIAEIDPSLADCFAIVWWRGGDEALQNDLLSEADVVLAYGGNETLAQIARAIPITTRYLPYGHKISFSLIGREAIDSVRVHGTARRAAYDVMNYDQQGCYSPQIFFVEKGATISPEQFASYLAGELNSFEEQFPRRSLSKEEALSLAKWRQSQELRALADPHFEFRSDTNGAWAITIREQFDEFIPSALNRTISIVAVDDLSEVPSRVADFRHYLQSVAIASSPERVFALSDRLAQSGVTRVCALGNMTAPEAGWHHDGRFNLLDLVSLTEIEQSAYSSAQAFAAYVD